MGALKESRLYRESQTSGNKSWQQYVPSEVDRPEFPSLPAPMIQAQTERHKRCQKCEGKSAEIQRLRKETKEKAILLEDVFTNASIQEKFHADMKATLKEERRISAQLRQEILTRQTDLRKLQQELAHYKRQCEDLTQQFEFEQRQRYEREVELETLRQECAQNLTFISSLQHQLREAKQSEQQIRQELAQTKDELSRCKEDHMRAMRERDQLNRQQLELLRERDNLNTRLSEMSNETERVRDDLDCAVREKREVIEERDGLVRQKDSQIHDLQRRLRENADTQEHHTSTTQILISLGDGWNVPHEDIKIIMTEKLIEEHWVSW